MLHVGVVGGAGLSVVDIATRIGSVPAAPRTIRTVIVRSMEVGRVSGELPLRGR